MATLDAAGEPLHPGQQRHGDVEGVRRKVLLQAAPGLEVAGRVEQPAFGVERVAAGPAALLLIAFERLGCSGMDHVADVRLVDAHAERDRGDDDPAAVVDEGILVAAAIVVGHAGVVGQGGVAERGQLGGDLFHVDAADAVNEARLVAVAVEDLADLADADPCGVERGR